MRADGEVDALYRAMRDRFGGRAAGANGYVSTGFFRREQALVLDLIAAHAPAAPRPATVLDIACGSGLMLGDPVARDRLPAGLRVVGVDYNARACRDAAVNGLAILRGDAFRLPVASETMDLAINCQFLNQQARDARAPFLAEAARVLAPGGHLILLWRRADSLLHRGAHALVSARDRLTGRPIFPQVAHPMPAIAAAAEAAGFAVVTRGTTLPVAVPGRAAPVVPASGLVGRLVGASNLLVLRRKGGA